ncbi:hypothetical protein Poli38472_003306 [Pythium oligandrum]|uniref:Protoporphyrinogen oxidase n=1 Tax=Pythium oligandrum TaxID=41045 RepID=A0A8K1C6A3_PYTOL|nr:hypothetical protein Poli38472_003306 [Pythium oligandrum]|eukprot:TMW57381.1 hypothetical protein Poli38472_003306 [Pythium oligandrum]
MKDIVVLGGGLSGLSLAYFLRQSLRTLPVQVPTRIRVLEASGRAGGWVQTAQRGDFLFEDGPRGFRPSRNGAEMLRLVEQLDLKKEMRAVDAAAKSRYVLRNGQVEKLPTSVKEILTWPLTLDVVKAGIHEVFTAPTTQEDETIYNFIARRFSPVVAERLLDPVASGIFGGDIGQLSVRACFRLLWDLEQQHGSVVRGMLFGKSSGDGTLLDGSIKSDFIRQHENSVSVSFKDGMSTLIRALEAEIANDDASDVLLNTKVAQIESTTTGNFTVHTESGEKINATHVFSTLPSFQLTPAVEKAFPDLAETLKTIRFVSMGTVHVGFNDAVLKSDGFGYLVPTCEKERVLGVIFDSNAFPSQNAETHTLQTRLSVMCGGAHFPEIEQITKDEFEGLALEGIGRHLGIRETPDYVHSVVLRNCIPQYHVGFHKTLAKIESQLAPGLQLGGNSFYGIGLADCVTRSKELALSFAQSIQQQQ